MGVLQAYVNQSVQCLTQDIVKPKPQHELRVSSFTANSDVSIVHTVSPNGGGGGKKYLNDAKQFHSCF
jgi:hypothetical protein